MLFASLILWTSLASAAPLATLPGRAVTVLPCTSDPDDACWQEARVLERFAPDRRVAEPAVEADLRLAWRDGAVLLRVGALPPHTEVELTLHSTHDWVPRTAEIVRGSSGVLVLEHSSPIGAPGEERAVELTLFEDRGEEPPLGRTWTPAGPAHAGEAFQALFTHQVSAELPLRASLDGAVLDLVVPGASEVHLKLLTDWPSSHRGKMYPADWSEGVVGDRLSVSAGEPGWYEITARARDDQGSLTGLRAWRTWLLPPPPATVGLGELTPGANHDIALVLEDLLDQGADVGLVIHHQDVGCAHGSPSSLAMRVGRPRAVRVGPWAQSPTGRSRRVRQSFRRRSTLARRAGGR